MPSSRNRVLVEGALAVAFSVVFSAIRLWTMPQGGSITLEMVPLFLFALRRGGRAGIAAGAVSGLLQLFTGGYVIHPVQAVLDYPAAFGALGIAGFFPRASWFGMVLGGVVRFVCHVLSGVIFFSSFAPEGANVWIYSSVYNGTFLLPTLVITAVLVSLIRPRLARVGLDRE